MDNELLNDLAKLFDPVARFNSVDDLDWEEREIGHNQFLMCDCRAEARDASKESIAQFIDTLDDQGNSIILEEEFAISTSPLRILDGELEPTFTEDDLHLAEKQPSPERAAIMLYELAKGLPNPPLYARPTSFAAEALAA